MCRRPFSLPPRWEEEKKRVEGGGGCVGSQAAKIKNNLHIQY